MRRIVGVAVAFVLTACPEPEPEPKSEPESQSQSQSEPKPEPVRLEALPGQELPQAGLGEAPTGTWTPVHVTLESIEAGGTRIAALGEDGFLEFISRPGRPPSYPALEDALQPLVPKHGEAGLVAIADARVPFATVESLGFHAALVGFARFGLAVKAGDDALTVLPLSLPQTGAAKLPRVVVWEDGYYVYDVTWTDGTEPAQLEFANIKQYVCKPSRWDHGKLAEHLRSNVTPGPDKVASAYSDETSPIGAFVHVVSTLRAVGYTAVESQGEPIRELSIFEMQSRNNRVQNLFAGRQETRCPRPRRESDGEISSFRK